MATWLAWLAFRSQRQPGERRRDEACGRCCCWRRRAPSHRLLCHALLCATMDRGRDVKLCRAVLERGQTVVERRQTVACRALVQGRTADAGTGLESNTRWPCLPAAHRFHHCPPPPKARRHLSLGALPPTATQRRPSQPTASHHNPSQPRQCAAAKSARCRHCGHCGGAREAVGSVGRALLRVRVDVAALPRGRPARRARSVLMLPVEP
jgi:hypothetical protein